MNALPVSYSSLEAWIARSGRLASNPAHVCLFATASLLVVACSRPISLPPSARADARPEYRTAVFVVQAPRGHWVTDSVLTSRNIQDPDCSSTGIWSTVRGFEYVDSVLLAGIGGPTLGEQRFYQLRGFQFNPLGVLNPHEEPAVQSCVAITAWAIKNPHGFPSLDSLLATVRSNVEHFRGRDMHEGVWGNRFYDTVGRLVETRVQGRSFYEVRVVAAQDSAITTFGRRENTVLYLTADKVFRFYFAGREPDPTDPDLILVLETFTPL